MAVYSLPSNLEVLAIAFSRKGSRLLPSEGPVWLLLLCFRFGFDMTVREASAWIRMQSRYCIPDAVLDGAVSTSASPNAECPEGYLFLTHANGSWLGFRSPDLG